MIKFTCPKCQKKLGVENVHAGKTIRCPQCGTSVTVPNDEVPLSDERTIHASTSPASKTAESRSHSTASSASSGLMPRWVWGLLITWVAIMVLSLGLYLGFRDTWERDHYAEIQLLADQANITVNSGNVKEGMETYDRLFQLVGTRVLKGASRNIVESARTGYPLAQEKYENNITSSFSSSLADILTSMNKHVYPANTSSVATLNDMQSTIDHIITVATVRNPQGNKLKTFVVEVQQAKRLIQDQVTKLTKQIKMEEQKRLEAQRLSEQKRKKIQEEEQKRLAEKEQFKSNPQPEQVLADFKRRMARFQELTEAASSKFQAIKLRYNVEQSSSMVFPYTATLEFTSVLKSLPNNPYSYEEHRVELGFSNGTWELTERSRKDLKGIWRDYHWGGYQLCNNSGTPTGGYSTDALAELEDMAFTGK